MNLILCGQITLAGDIQCLLTRTTDTQLGIVSKVFIFIDFIDFIIMSLKDPQNEHNNSTENNCF